MVFIGEIVEWLRPFTLLARMDWLSPIDRDSQTTRPRTKCPGIMHSTLTNVFVACAKRVGSTQLCAAMVLEEKAMNLQPQDPYVHLSKCRPFQI
jgi:hypothetical protein